MTMWEERKLRQALSRSSLLIAYIFLVTGAVVAFMYMQSITEQVERESLLRASENCEAVNRTKATITAILDRLAEERQDDTPEAFLERQRLRAELNELLVPNECPPPPPPLGERDDGRHDH